MPRFPSFERKSPVSEFGPAGWDGPDDSGCLTGQNGQARRVLGRPGGRWKGWADPAAEGGASRPAGASKACADARGTDVGALAGAETAGRTWRMLAGREATGWVWRQRAEAAGGGQKRNKAARVCRAVRTTARMAGQGAAAQMSGRVDGGSMGFPSFLPFTGYPAATPGAWQTFAEDIGREVRRCRQEQKQQRI